MPYWKIWVKFPLYNAAMLIEPAINRRQKIWRFLRQYQGTLLGCGIVTAICTQRGAYFMVAFAGFFFILWVLIRLLLLVFKNPSEWRHILIKSALWLSAFALIEGIHWHYAQDARQRADAIIAQVRVYHQQHGTYPEHLAQLPALNVESPVLLRKYGMGYHKNEQQARLFYSSTSMLFDRWVYDFDEQTWTYLYD